MNGGGLSHWKFSIIFKYFLTVGTDHPVRRAISLRAKIGVSKKVSQTTPILSVESKVKVTSLSFRAVASSS